MLKQSFSIQGQSIVVRFDLIDRDPGQPRKLFDEKYIRELADNIKVNGLLHPVYLRPNSQMDGRYILVAGECRFRALKLICFEEYEFRLVDKDVPSYVISLIENEFRKDLNPIEKAESYRECMQRESMSVADLSACTGKHFTEIYRFLRLLELPEQVQDLIRKGKLTQRGVKYLFQFQDVAKQIEFAETILRGEDPPELVEASTRDTLKEGSGTKLASNPVALISRMLRFRGDANRMVPIMEAFLNLSEEEQVRAWTSFTKVTRENFFFQMSRFANRLASLNTRMETLPETKRVAFGNGVARMKSAEPLDVSTSASPHSIKRV